MLPLCRRLFCIRQTANVRLYAKKKEKVFKTFHDPLDQATGLEKKELLALLSGNCDPYRMNPIKRGPGTCDKPNLIPSAFDKRIVGCICSEHAMHINFMWLHHGVPKRCECGYWFELCPVASFV